jgi:phage terminase small subunit
MKNLKWKKFADEYLIDMNASRAYVAAGYSNVTPEKNAYKLLEKKEIKEYIKKEQDKTTKKLQITREDIINDLIKIKEANIDDWPPHALKALEMLNKMLGYNEPEKSEVTVRQEPPLFSDEDLED